ncbi:MAG: hypothetical protein KKE17_14115 [Proteobacteria bacterium]|nr:hypothetical protein [Pseudomonadota bacterium]MBU1711135.1 hypothetical protein [Pseudomonadota bacterium]
MELVDVVFALLVIAGVVWNAIMTARSKAQANNPQAQTEITPAPLEPAVYEDYSADELPEVFFAENKSQNLPGVNLSLHKPEKKSSDKKNADAQRCRKSPGHSGIRLCDLRKAVIWSEILAPPVGLRNEERLY